MSDLLSGVKSAKPEFMSEPYIGHCKVQGYVTSQTIENAASYKGSPFVRFKLSTEAGVPGSATFWLPKQGDDANKANGKNLRLQRFLTTIGVDVKNTPTDKLLDAAIGKEFEGAFAKREYIGKAKDTKEPVVKSSVDLAFSNPSGEGFGGSINMSKLFTPLSEEDVKKLAIQHDNWKNSAKGQQTQSSPAPNATGSMPNTASDATILEDDKDDDDEDDLPF